MELPIAHLDWLERFGPLPLPIGPGYLRKEESALFLLALVRRDHSRWRPGGVLRPGEAVSLRHANRRRRPRFRRHIQRRLAPNPNPLRETADSRFVGVHLVAANPGRLDSPHSGSAV